MANDAATLVYLAGQASITLHAWLSRRDRLEQPDRMIFDLDPSDGTGHAEVREAAITIGELLREIGLTPWPMTTGSRGYHVTIPLRRGPDHDTVRAFARDVAELAIAQHPDTFTLEQRKAKREGRILIDIMRNAYAHTAVAPYAVRARVRGASRHTLALGRALGLLDPARSLDASDRSGSRRAGRGPVARDRQVGTRPQRRAEAPEVARVTSSM